MRHAPQGVIDKMKGETNFILFQNYYASYSYDLAGSATSNLDTEFVPPFTLWNFYLLEMMHGNMKGFTVKKYFNPNSRLDIA